jgi:mannose-1-phosphate guanylyltransferase
VSRILPVILCGGSGTRLWPLSRDDRPKQFLSLTGSETMLQLTLARVGDPAIFDPPMLVGSYQQSSELEVQIAEGGIGSFTLLLEPCARDTAGAIALAALSAGRPDQIILVMPSDHLIPDRAEFVSAVQRARPFAEEGWLTTFGITPSRPETGYGYIRCGGDLGGGVFEAARFVEKPDAVTAQHYLDEGGYRWNAGIFLFRADAYLAELDRQAPQIAEAARAAIALSPAGSHSILPDHDAFAECPRRSVDYAVMENAPRVAVVPVDMDWSDLGSWDALRDVSARDAEGNSVTGPGTLIETRDCLLRSTGVRIVALGVEDLIIVSTGDAVMVVPRGKSHLVKQAVEELRSQSPELLFSENPSRTAED